MSSISELADLLMYLLRALLTLLVGSSHALRLSIPPLSRASVRMAIEPAVLREVAIYDSEKEEEIQDLRARLASADWNAHQNRELVHQAQQDLQKQEDMRKTLKAEIASLKDGMAEAEAKLQTKTDEVDSVQKELKAAGKSVTTLMAELSTVKAELAERTTEVIALNQHLEAHAGATERLKREVDELKAAASA